MGRIVGVSPPWNSASWGWEDLFYFLFVSLSSWLSLNTSSTLPLFRSNDATSLPTLTQVADCFPQRTLFFSSFYLTAPHLDLTARHSDHWHLRSLVHPHLRSPVYSHLRSPVYPHLFSSADRALPTCMELLSLDSLSIFNLNSPHTHKNEHFFWQSLPSAQACKEVSHLPFSSSVHQPSGVLLSTSPHVQSPNSCVLLLPLFDSVVSQAEPLPPSRTQADVGNYRLRREGVELNSGATPEHDQNSIASTFPPIPAAYHVGFGWTFPFMLPLGGHATVLLFCILYLRQLGDQCRLKVSSLMWVQMPEVQEPPLNQHCGRPLVSGVNHHCVFTKNVITNTFSNPAFTLPLAISHDMLEGAFGLFSPLPPSKPKPRPNLLGV